MDKLDSILHRYQHGGVREVAKGIWMYLLLWGPPAPYIKSLAGDVLHQKLIAYPRLGYWPQIQNPRTFNEKVMNRKLFTNEDIYVTVSDKIAVREYVEAKVGSEVLNEIYYVTDEPDTIPFDTLPDEFVIKPTHGSGWVRIVDDKEDADLNELKHQCLEWLSEKYGDLKEEYWYTEIEPNIIVERRLRDEDYSIPPDFKFFVFHGNVEYIQVDSGRFSNHNRRFYDRNWICQNFKRKYPPGPEVDKPHKLNKMIDVAESLGEGFDFIRVDLYLLNDQNIVFGELTLAPGSGSKPFYPREYDFEFGSLW